MHERKREEVGGKEENGRDERRAMSGEWNGMIDGVGKWRTAKRDAQREEREDSGWRGPRQGAGERNEKQRERERKGTSGNGSIESAAQRNAPPLLWSGSFAGAPPRPRASEREKENDGTGEGETEKEGERKGLTEAEGRPTYIRRPIPMQGEEDERRAKQSRVGLGQVYPSSTHTALSCVCHPAEENHTKAEAQPLHEREDHRGFPVLASGFPENARNFSNRKKKKESAHHVRQLRVPITRDRCRRV